MSYKNYQQVFQFVPGIGNTSPRPIRSQATPKRRTKTGCLTCRSRKKKCDEEIHGGKCQACIRNFLDCSWPKKAVSKPAAKPAAKTVDVKTPETEASRPPHDLATPSMEQKLHDRPQENLKPKTYPDSSKETPRGASAYPSPVASPSLEGVETVPGLKAPKVNENIQAMTLPPIRLPPIKLPPIEMKVQKPQPRRAGTAAKFIITSLDSNCALLSIEN